MGTCLCHLVRLFKYGYCCVVAGQGDGCGETTKSCADDDHVERIRGDILVYIFGSSKKMQAITWITGLLFNLLAIRGINNSLGQLTLSLTASLWLFPAIRELIVQDCL